MEPKQVLFDGYCPESLLKGKRVEMRLNEDDIWESEATGLQVTVLPPFAAILRWRGKGKLKASSDVASNIHVGLLLAEAKREKGKEIFPDDSRLIDNEFDLEWYIDEVYDSKEELTEDGFNLADPVLQEQVIHLNSIIREDYNELLQQYDELKSDLDAQLLYFDSPAFNEFHKQLYALKLIFDFEWMKWRQGQENINTGAFDYSHCSLLELSMYLTTIFRSDRFSDGEIEANIKNGNIDRIMQSLRNKIP